MNTSLHTPCSRASQRGSAVIVVFALIVIMMMLAAINTTTLNWLKSEVHLVEKQQKMRMTAPNATPAAVANINTNTPPSK